MPAIGSMAENKPLSLRQVTAAEYRRYDNHKRTLASIDNNVDSRPTKQIKTCSPVEGGNTSSEIKVKIEDKKSIVAATVPKRSCLKNSTYGSDTSLPSSKMQVTNGHRKSRWGPKVVIPDENNSQVNVVKVEKKKVPLNSCLKQSSDTNEVKVKAEKISSMPIGELKKEANFSSQETAAASLQPSQQPTSEKAALDAVVQFAIDTGKVDSKLFKTALASGYSKFFILSKVEGHLLKQKPCANASSAGDDEASESNDDDDIQTDVLYKDDYSVINDARELLPTDNQVTNYSLRNRTVVNIALSDDMKAKILSVLPINNGENEGVSLNHIKSKVQGFKDLCNKDWKRRELLLTDMADDIECLMVSLTSKKGREFVAKRYFRASQASSLLQANITTSSGKPEDEHPTTPSNIQVSDGMKAKILSLLPVNNGENEGVRMSHIIKNVKGFVHVFCVKDKNNKTNPRIGFEACMANHIEIVMESCLTKNDKVITVRKYFRR